MPTRQRTVLSSINVVPYIDVMLVLLIILMVTAPLFNQGVDVDLPQAKASPLKHLNQEPVVVSVNAGGQYFLNLSQHPNQPMAPKALLLRVAAIQKLDQQLLQSRPILVKGDQSARYGQVLTAMALLQHAGAQHIGLVTRPLPSH